MTYLGVRPDLRAITLLLALATAGTGAACAGESPPPVDDHSQGGSGALGDGDGDDHFASGGVTGDGDGDGDGDGGGGGDGDGDGDEVTEHLSLVAQYPPPGDTNANAFVPITLRFSDDVEPSTVQAAIAVQVEGKTIEYDAAVRGATVDITLQSIPSLPARVSVAVTKQLEAEGGGPFDGDSFSFVYPLWHQPDSDLPASDGPILLCARESELLLIQSVAGLLVTRIQRGLEWHALAAPTDLPATALATFPTQGGPLVLYVVGDEVRAARLNDDDTWTHVEHKLSVDEDSLIAAGSDANDRAVVAWATGSNLQVAILGTEGWVSGSPKTFAQNIQELSVSADKQDPLVAVVHEDGDIGVLRFDGVEWRQLGGTLDRERTGGSVQVQIHAGSDIYLAYLDGDEVSNNVQVKRFDRTSPDGDWKALGSALDLFVDGEASLPKMALDVNGVPMVSWVEVDSGTRRLLVAKAEGEGFRFQGTAAIANLANPASHLSLMLDSNGFPVVAVGTEDATTLRRFNGSPTLPHGLTARSESSGCHIPEDGDDFPQTLAETGCYIDIQRGQLVADAVPFNINSPLWSDAAHKRRFVVLPSNRTIEYRETGTLGFPTGTILIKEFQIERTTGMPQSLSTMETRFLVKRCEFDDDGCAESWQGYSYMWNDAGTAATLLDAGTTKLWDVTTEGVPRKHEHIYPSRDECTQCHVNAKGGALGPQAPQLNRPEVYGDVIENQLSAWSYAGFFGDTGPSVAPESLAVIPSPADVGRSLEERTAGYFHANCGHCHQPEGQRPIPDLTYFGPGLDALVCVDATSTTKLPGKYIVPGDHTQSVIFLRDEARDGAAGIQMPPLASSLPDVRQLAVTQAYIDSLPGTCP